MLCFFELPSFHEHRVALDCAVQVWEAFGLWLKILPGP